jgi:hypothetical protein
MHQVTVRSKSEMLKILKRQSVLDVNLSAEI